MTPSRCPTTSISELQGESPTEGSTCGRKDRENVSCEDHLEEWLSQNCDESVVARQNVSRSVCGRLDGCVCEEGFVDGCRK